MMPYARVCFHYSGSNAVICQKIMRLVGKSERFGVSIRFVTDKKNALAAAKRVKKANLPGLCMTVDIYEENET